MNFNNIKNKISNCFKGTIVRCGIGNIYINSLNEDIKDRGAKLYDMAVTCQNFEFEQKSLISRESHLKECLKNLEIEIMKNRAEMKFLNDKTEASKSLDAQYAEYMKLSKALTVCTKKKSKLEKQINKIVKRFDKAEAKRENKKLKRDEIQHKMQENTQRKRNEKIKSIKKMFDEKEAETNYTDAFNIPIFNVIEGLFDIDESVFQEEGSPLYINNHLNNSENMIFYTNIMNTIREDYKIDKNNNYCKDIVNSTDIQIENGRCSYDEVLKIRSVNGFYELVDIDIKEQVNESNKKYITEEMKDKLIENRGQNISAADFMYGMDDNFVRLPVGGGVEYIQSEDGMFTQKISVKEVEGKTTYTYKPVLSSNLKFDLKNSKYKDIIKNSIGVEKEITEKEYSEMVQRYEEKDIDMNCNNEFEMEI